MLVDKYESGNHSKVTLRQAQDDFAPPSSLGKGAGGLGSSSESAGGLGSRVYLEKMSQTYVKKQMTGIVGFEILIEDIQAAYKLSQNRNEEDFDNVILELEKRGDPQSVAVAEEMKKHKK